MLPFLAGSVKAVEAETQRGRIVGGLDHEIPGWFKESFLDLKEDATEAGDAGKHLLLFMTLNGCPYCTKMLEEVMQGEKDYIQKYFDSIAINIRGARMVTPVDADEMTEKEFAGKMRVIFTPTILFLDGKGKQVFRINGLWTSEMFRHALDYVQSRSYNEMSLPAFIKTRASARSKKPVYSFRDNDLLVKLNDFSTQTGPVAILFEDRNCTGCNVFHDKYFNREAIRSELKKYVFTRLDTDSKQPVKDFAGNLVTPAKWAEQLGVTSRPALVLFDNGRQYLKITSELYDFHFKVALRYVSGGHYKKYKNWIAYLGDEQDRILKSGQNIDIGDLAPKGE